MTQDCSAWNPGLAPDIPPAYRRLETIHHPDNVRTRLEDLDEIASQTGLSAQDLVAFRPERLALHELIVRVTANVLVQEGEDENELGMNCRRIIRHILDRYVQPRMEEIRALHEGLGDRVRARVRRELQDALYSRRAQPPRPEGFRFPFPGLGRKKTAAAPRETTPERERRAISGFREKAGASEDPLDRAIYRSLSGILGTIGGNRGFLGPDPELLTRLVCDHVCSTHGSALIGERLTPWFEDAIRREGYPGVRIADKPLLISLKGASAAGKSSLRPMLRRVMTKQGMVAEGYATISPDIWRRLLLDYDSLGAAYKYSGRLTGRELIIIDGKLDLYIRNRAEREGSIPHILVDRFRFDSFSTERISKILHDTYVRHVHGLYMYFVITPPHETVERGWIRGLETGRYKSVEDFLDHCVEAYVGMPRILFKWLAEKGPLFSYELLDNSVPKGTFPRTVAFGTREEMSILDCAVMVAIERYQKINIRARGPEEVYPSGASWSLGQNMGFLRQCVRRIPRVRFLEPGSRRPYLEARGGRFRVLDEALLEHQCRDEETKRIFALLAPDLLPVRADGCGPDSRGCASPPGGSGSG